MEIRSCVVGFSLGKLKGFSLRIVVVGLVISPPCAVEGDGDPWWSSGGPRRWQVVRIIDF